MYATGAESILLVSATLPAAEVAVKVYDEPFLAWQTAAARFREELPFQQHSPSTHQGAPMRYRLFVICTLAACLFSTAATVAPLAAAEEAAAADTISVFGNAKLEVPAAWERTEPKSSIIEHEFVAKTGEGEDAPKARITMMASGGGVKANIDRWKGQFTGGDAAAQKTEETKIGNWTVHIADLSGSFAETMGGGPFSGGKTVKRENYAMTGVILVHPEGQMYFIKVTGPMDIVKANRPAVVEMLGGLK